MLCSPSHSDDSPTCTDSHAHASAPYMLMQLLHAHSTTVLAQARPTMFCIRLVTNDTFTVYWGEPERAPHRRVCCEFSIYFFISIVRRAVNHFLLVFCVSLRHALIQTTNEQANDIDTNHANHERSTSTRMETIARGEGLKHFMKTGRVLQAISCPACRAHYGV